MIYKFFYPKKNKDLFPPHVIAKIASYLDDKDKLSLLRASNYFQHHFPQLLNGGYEEKFRERLQNEIISATNPRTFEDLNIYDAATCFGINVVLVAPLFSSFSTSLSTGIAFLGVFISYHSRKKSHEHTEKLLNNADLLWNITNRP